MHRSVYPKNQTITEQHRPFIAVGESNTIVSASIHCIGTYNGIALTDRYDGLGINMGTNRREKVGG